eukprot:CAMPEP_0204618330 /NCGR_PEP_ID=MMETSP0717-20131115/5011_1 /ASSEMBLY_ACC=CAM_ASM_000666 /TAXON_ID=230516 /ORGANISM="Chaetoceros curvisetus" /LENGTH=102 /DNA_ID=CAMNT_0051632037 /DNA_START=78 /DNA_END=384 /DNA_ORIENTATION=-
MNHFPTIDAILSHHAKNLKPGESISIPLYKSRNGTITSADPLQKSRASKQAAAMGAKNVSKSVLEKKYGEISTNDEILETVEDPDFGAGGMNSSGNGNGNGN